MAGDGVLETVGAELMGILSPVSACMLLVVILVRLLIPNGASGPTSSMAILVYDEVSSDSDAQKFGGALLNALVFVAIITVVTFLLVALFYFRCTKCLRIYMGFSALMVLGNMGGALGVTIVQTFSLPIDVITFSVLLFNFSVVGVLSVFFRWMPIIFTQGYLVIIGMLVAFWMTMLPEWTTWALLLAMAAYDVVAVLMPHGPLNLLVQLAIARDEDIPALIYEARPVSVRVSDSQQQTAAPPQQMRRWRRRSSSAAAAAAAAAASNESLATKIFRGIFRWTKKSTSYSSISTESEIHLQSESNQRRDIHSEDDADERDPESSPSLPPSPSPSPSQSQPAPLFRAMQREDEVEEEESSSGIKLGLGDFIFYSVLVGRAAMFDLMTVYACYLAIVAGLGATLVLLAVWRRALPALPISISLGVLFYFLTRLIMDPFIVQLATHLIFF